MSASPVNVGDVLAGKYRVERVLGVGGMGVVVAAKHLVLGERVALKFLLPAALERDDVVARFVREGQAAARIRNEHVARVFDTGRLDDGAPYLVMEYLEGADLGAVLRKKGPLPVDVTVEYVMQACLALADAHSLGVIHRDLKPSNLFLTRGSDGSPSIKVIDFGISKVTVPEGEAHGGEMTQTAVMMGSPLYMAPEQMTSARDVDARADIWSLGIILHTLLAGTPPFDAQSVMQVYERILQGAPPLRAARPDAPAGLEAAILRCLQKDRARRFADVGELADAIAEFGPAHARYDADKVKRIVGASAARQSAPPPGSSVPAVSAIVPPSLPSSVSVRSTRRGLGDSAPDPHGPTTAQGSGIERTPPPTGPDGADPSNTAGPWDQKTHAPAGRRSRVALIAASVAAVAVAAPLAFFVLRSRDGASAPVTPATDTAAIRASAPATTVVPAPPSAEPSVAPASTSIDLAAPTPSGEPSASASARVTHTPRKAPTTGPAPPPRKPGGDHLFDDQGVIRK